MSNTDTIAPDDRSKKILKLALEGSLLRFSRYFCKEVLGYRMIINEHHKLLAKTLERVHAGEIKRLVINIPPGYTKTEMAVVCFIAWSIAKNHRSRFIHATYSQELALKNSSAVRDIVTSEKFQELWPLALRKDTRAKGAWETEPRGGMQARAAGGPITGFRAGQPPEAGEDPENPRFSGALIIDDPLKPDDAKSILTTDTINSRFNGTFKSRLMKESVTPIILIMQRISDNDPSAFLLNGGMGCKWHHLCMPALIETHKVKKYSHSIPIGHKQQPGSLWEYKFTVDELKKMEISDPYVYAAQYQQNPVPLGGGIFKENWFNYYRPGTVQFEYTFITADCANKTKTVNDYSVFCHWGVLKGNLYLIDMIRNKWEAPQLVVNAHLFWCKHFNPTTTSARLRFMAVEDKANGTALIQYLRQSTSPVIPVKAVQRGIDKVTRAYDAAPYIASGHVFLPEGAEFTLDFKAEVLQFTAALTHRHDDITDNLMDAVDLVLMPSKKTARVL